MLIFTQEEKQKSKKKLTFQENDFVERVREPEEGEGQTGGRTRTASRR